MKKLFLAFLAFASFQALGNHQYCTTARVVCSLGATPSEGSLCNSSCSGNNNLVNGSNSCFSGGLTRWGFYMFSIEQSGTLSFTINPDAPSFFEDGDYNFALFDVTSGCGSIGNAIRCSRAYNSSDPAANTGLNMGSTDTTEGAGGDGWLKYLWAECGHTYILCLDVPGNDGNGFSLSFGGSCTFGAPSDFTASADSVCAGVPVTYSLACNISNAFITYQWNFGPNATPSSFTGMSPPTVTYSTNGPQTVTLTSTFTAGSSCTGSTTKTTFITNAAPSSDFTFNSPVCTGTNTTVTYAGNASSSATYTWNFGGGTIVSGSGQGPYTISWPGTGDYIITLDVNECSTSSGVTTDTATVFPSPTANAGSDDTICAGSNTVLSASGGTSYSWLPSTGLSCSLCQSPTASPGTTTNYTVAVMDANGCMATDALTVIVNQLPPASAGSDQAFCSGGSVILNASGGIIYSWSPPTGLSNVNVSNPTANPSSSTTYTVTVTDANNCNAMDDVTVTVYLLPVASAGSDVSICNGDNTTLNATGGTTYLWSPSTGLSSTTVSNPTANPTSTTTYILSVTDANSCTDTDTMTVTVNQLPPANAGPDAGICTGSNTTLNASGGTSYSWSPGTGLSGTTIANPVASPPSTTTYTVTVSDGICTNTDDVTVTVYPVPVASILTQTNVNCFGGNNGSATVTVSSGTIPYSYLWTPTSQSTQTATGLTAGAYSVFIADANSCTTSVNVTITEPPTFAVTISKTDVTCYGFNDGSAIASVTGGVPSYTYLWLPGGGSGISATGLAANTYTIVVSDANGCTTSSTEVITQPSILGVSITATPVTCYSLCDGSASATGSGGIIPYTFDWSNGIMNTATVTGLCTGTYAVITTDANGCTTTANEFITEPAELIASTSGVLNVLCNGSCTGSITASVTGGTIPYSYSWSGGGSSSLCAGTYTVTVSDSNGCTDTATATITEPAALSVSTSATNAQCYSICNGSASATVSGGVTSYSYIWNNGISGTSQVTGLCDGTYTVTVTDANLCTVSSQAVITEPPALSISHIVTNVYCNEQCVGSGAVITSGGIQPYTYAWSNGGTNVMEDSLCGGIYMVTATDANGCSITDAMTVLVIPASQITVWGDSIACNEDSAQIFASGGVSYIWSPAAELSNATIFNPYATPDSVTNFMVVMTDNYGCKDTGYIRVRHSIATADAGQDVEINYGSGNPIYATGEGSYVWYPFTGLSCFDCPDPYATPLKTTTYHVTVTNSDGCTATDSLTVTVIISDVVFVPDIFTPNGDGKNDVVYVRATAIRELLFVIYDRWGEKVFESTDVKKGWDGTFRDQPADPAVYVYYVKAILVNDNEVKLKGDVTLVR